MNFNATSGRQAHRLVTKRLPQEIEITPNVGTNPLPTYNPYDSLPSSGYQQNNQYVSPGPPQPNMYSTHQSAPYNPGSQYGYPPADGGLSIPNLDPVVANVAMQYGQHLMGTGKQYMDREMEKYLPVSRLKYYFAVDTSYVLNKLRLLFFPFTNQDWSLKYAPTEPIQPRFDLNAPDLYIPTMAYLTYVLVAGLALGTQVCFAIGAYKSDLKLSIKRYHTDLQLACCLCIMTLPNADRFAPEALGIQASSALIWTILEVFVYVIYLYITNIATSLTTIDIIAFAGYKFTGIIFAILTSIVFLRTGYLCALAYSAVTLAYFLIRTLKVRVLSVNNPTQTGNTRRMYLLVTVACLQPILMWFLSYHLVPSSSVVGVAAVESPLPPGQPS